MPTLIASHGVRVLRNEIVKTLGLSLVRFDYMKADESTFDMHPSADTRTIKVAMVALPLDKKSPSVPMHQSPVGVHYIEEAGVSLMVAGHSHAGQLLPAMLIAAP